MSRVIVHGFIPINRKCLILIFLTGWIIGRERQIFMELTCPVWSLIPRSLFPVSIAIIKLQNQIISCMAMNHQLFLKLNLNQASLGTYTKVECIFYTISTNSYVTKCELSSLGLHG